MRKIGQNELNNNIIDKKTKNNSLYAGKLADRSVNSDCGSYRLAFYIGSLHKGGAERVFINLAEYFSEQGYQVVMVTQYRKEDEYELPEGIERVISDITPQETSKSRIINFLRRIRKLHRIWKMQQIDLVLSCAGKNNFMTIVTTMFTKTKPVVSVVGEAGEEYPNTLMKMLANLLFPLAAGVILQTERSRSFFSKRVGKTAVILPNSLNPNFLRERYEGERDKRIVSVGRLDENKNHEMMIRVFVKLMEKYPDYTLTIYGEGELHTKLRDIVGSLQAKERVFLPGTIPDVAEKIEKASLFLLTSYSEGVSNALIEAMALGLPVIATDVPSGGTVELIEHGQNGWIIPTGDEKALMEAIDTILSDAALANRLGTQAHKIQERLAPDKVNRQWQTYFEKCLRNAR